MILAKFFLQHVMIRTYKIILFASCSNIERLNIFFVWDATCIEFRAIIMTSMSATIFGAVTMDASIFGGEC